MHFTRKRIVFTLIILSLLIIPFIPVHAVQPVVNSTCSSNDQTTTNVSCTMTTAVASDTIIVWIGSDSSSGNPANTVVSIADGGDTFVKQVSGSLVPSCCSGAPISGEIWSASHISGTTVTVTATMSQSGASVITTEVNAISVSNIASITAFATSTGSCNVNPGTCGTLTTSTTNTFNSATDIAVGGWIGRGTSLFSNGINFTPNPTDGLGNCKIVGTGTIGCQEYTTNGATSPTNYPMVCASCSSSNVVAAFGIGAIFGTAPATSTTSALTTTVTRTLYSTHLVAPSLSKCTDTNSCVTNQSSQFLTVLLPSIIIIALLEYFPYKMGIKDERVYVFIFMMIISGIGFLSSLGGFGNNGLPWYIPIFCDIVGFMLILSFKGNNGDGM